MKQFFKNWYLRYLKSRQDIAAYKVADMIKHDYPKGTSLSYIVKDLKTRHETMEVSK